jgi:hypothetical protein
MNSYPALFALAADGSLSLHNLDKNAPDFQIKNAGVIIDFMLNGNEIMTLMNNSSVIVRNMSGSIVRQGALPKAKSSYEKATSVTTCSCIPNWYIFHNAASNKV